MKFPQEWLYSSTAMALKIVGASSLAKFRPISGVVCDAKDTGPCLAQVIAASTVRDNPASVCAEDTCRRWPVPVGESSGTTRNGDGTAGREEGVRPVDHRAAFKATRLQSQSPFSMALIATIWDGSCMKPRLGSISSDEVRKSRGLPQGALELSVVFTMMVRSWNTRNLSWSLDGFVLPAICYADDVVLVAGSVWAAETMVEETIGTLKEVGLAVGAENSLDEPTKERAQLYHGRWTTGDVGNAGIRGSIVSLDRNARHAIAHRMAEAKHLEQFKVFRCEDGVSSETDLQKT